MNVLETNLGFEIKTSDFTLLFGGVNSQLPQLKEHYPQFKFVRLKQIHSDAVIETTSTETDYQILGDAHFTTHPLALCVVTADCVPAFLYDPNKSVVAGIHAGWRGVASRIIPKTIAQLKERGSNPEDIQVIIGPHIQKKSFEVEFDVRDQILSSLGPLNAQDRALFTEKISDTKALVDLNQVVKAQIQSEGVSLEKVFDLHLDTVTDPRFHSYRRDKEKSGRQISFIVLNK
ncbi:peptidoglycan editing factor PgeF [Bdellovibrio sp. HCB2-146]|uniref:peptidoglycan editing factor PgeF n=1 Tax=Bdellovibrio sp. HCB2-146 TaxID=3394362 RepID=UPI0039BC8367